MKTLIINAHPNENSFINALSDSFVSGLKKKGHEVKIRDLYRPLFNPILSSDDLAKAASGSASADIKAEQESLLWAENIALFYPLWWFGTPAILKGWFDRVLQNGFAFTYSAEGVKGLLKHKKAMAIITTGGPEDFFSAVDAKRIITEAVTHGTLGFCGIQQVESKIFYAVTSANDETRSKMLEEAEALANNF